MSTKPIPAAMRALVLHAYEIGSYASLAIEEHPVPRPGKGEVLVRVAAAPINPSDLASLQGLYGVKKALPMVPGIECSGTVVDAGSGWLAQRLIGKRVACAAGSGDGTWAEYVVAPATQCSALPASVDDEQGAMRIVNPYTAWAHLAIAQQAHARAIVQTAAASALGRMVVRLAQRRDVHVINIVRSEAQVETLRTLGAEYVLNSESPEFGEQLRERCRQLSTRLAFDAVAGSMTERLLKAMAPGSRVVVYGALSGSPIQLNPGEVIFNQQRIEGFYLSRWIARQPALALLSMQRQLYQLGDVTHARIQLRAPLGAAQQAIAAYEAQMSAGKVLLVPGLAD